MSSSSSYKAEIPLYVLHDKNLTTGAKMLYCEIAYVSEEKGYCDYSSSYLADIYKVSNVTILNWIDNLIDNGYITRKIIKDEKNKRKVKERRLYILR